MSYLLLSSHILQFLSEGCEVLILYLLKDWLSDRWGLTLDLCLIIQLETGSRAT